jgi:periplasmic protein TonB
METKAVVISHWEDLVFEKRNKLYGAYQLRRNYSKRVILGLGISVAFFAALLWSSQYTIDHGLVTVPPLDPGTRAHPDLPPVIVRPEVPKKQLQTSPRKNANTPPLVVSDPVDDEPAPPIDNNNSSTGDENGTEPVENFSDGSGTEPDGDPVVVEAPKTVTIAEVMPMFDGGNEGMMKYIKRNIRYPRSAERDEHEGTVYVQFVVMFDGRIEHVEMMRGFHPECDREAVRVISKMPKWSAASQNGKPVNVRMVVPIKFKLRN